MPFRLEKLGNVFHRLRVNTAWAPCRYDLMDSHGVLAIWPDSGGSVNDEHSTLWKVLLNCTVHSVEQSGLGGNTRFRYTTIIGSSRQLVGSIALLASC